MGTRKRCAQGQGFRVFQLALLFLLPTTPLFAANATSTDGAASFKGNVAIKRAKVNVNSASGGKTYTLVLRKYNIVDSDTGLSPVAKWIITDIEES